MTKLGVCYYPEHWPETLWAEDAARMADLGISIVRIGEFAWSRLEPDPGRYDFAWLERAMDILAQAGLEIVLGTPTATPPKWLIDRMPDMLPVGADGSTRGFGSRRHYCFSHDGYRAECARIVTDLAKAFGRHSAVVAWQTDNEYGCHDTTLSWSTAARHAFRHWLSQKYQSPDALNRAWGNVFWSMEYREFDEIELPNLTVTEANPAHIMDFRRFASEEVASFNKLQCDIIRKYSPGRDITHNFMGGILAFDHFDVGSDLDVASWDSYPLGFLEDRSTLSDNAKRTFQKTGDPDYQAFHHDLYRAVGKGRWWVMEQQPGPVNWAPRNPAPQPGMIALWTLEAAAHGAEVVSYFRWRQAPFAQEQMHTGLLRPDSEPSPGFAEAELAAKSLAALPRLRDKGKAEVAIVFDYPSAWAWEIQPQGQEFGYFALVYDLYAALRGASMNVDFVPAGAPALDGYKLVIVPGVFAWNDQILAALRDYRGTVLIGPRSGSKTEHFSIPAGLPPSLPDDLMDLNISQVESLRPDCGIDAEGGGKIKLWFEHASPGSSANAEIKTADGVPILWSQGRIFYLAGWPDGELANRIVRQLAVASGLTVCDLPPGIRTRRSGDLVFYFNYGRQDFDLRKLTGLQDRDEFLLGCADLPPSGVAVVRSTG